MNDCVPFEAMWMSGKLPLNLMATVPFDDRQCRTADVDDLRPLLQTFLKEVGSELHKQASKMPLVELGRQMNIVDGADEFVKPRNVGVLFFHDEPRTFIPGAQIDVVIFPDGPGGDVLIEKEFHGPLHEQVRDALRYVESSVIREKVIKHKDRAKATRLFNYPFPAVEEAVVKAHDEAHDELTETEENVLSFVVSQPKSRPEIAEHLGLKSRSGHLYKSIDHLRNLGLLELTIPDKPQSRNQKMRITEKGKAWLARPHE